MLSATLALGFNFNAPLPAQSRAVRASASITMADRPYLMAGNWKMNTLLPDAVALAKGVAAEAAKSADNVGVAVCAPFPFLAPVKDALAGSKVGLGAQDCYADADAGAFTGATSTAMLESAAPHVHMSQRRRPLNPQRRGRLRRTRQAAGPVRLGGTRGGA